MREYKVLPTEFKLKDDSGPGEFEGRASTFGTIDSYGDRIEPGAYTKTIPQFLTRGFIAAGHDWTSPIAMVIGAEERDDGLWIQGRFHSDPEAQKHRTRARERMEAGAFVGLSIGYEAKSWRFEEEIRVLEEIHLFEVSLVTVPAEANSGLALVKGRNLPFEDHTEQLREALHEWVERASAGWAMRAKAGRPISAARMEALISLLGSLRENQAVIEQLLQEAGYDSGSEEQPQEVVGLSADPDPALKQLFDDLFQYDFYALKGS